MQIVFVILIVLACVALGFVVLIQNPKGGGLAGNVGGLSNQFMGVKQTTDVLEKGPWLFAGIIALLALFSTLIFKGNTTSAVDTSNLNKVNTSTTIPTQSAPANTTTLPAAPQPKK